MYRRHGFLVKQERFFGLQFLLRFAIAGENLQDILMDRPIVVDNQDPSIGFDAGIDGVHAALFSGALLRLKGTSRIKVAPRPSPSLSARRVPPISRAASAPECRPKP